jgi:hypothetical protein
MTHEHHVLHGLCREKRKNRFKFRVMIARGKRLVGKRLVVDIPTTDEKTAVIARNAVLCFCGKLGLCVVRRAQARQEKKEDDAS